MVDRVRDEEERREQTRQELEDAPERVGGGLAGAAAGATAGAIVGGPIGAAAGGIIGGVIGATQGGDAILAAQDEAVAREAQREADIMERANEIYRERRDAGEPVTGPDAIAAARAERD